MVASNLGVQADKSGVDLDPSGRYNVPAEHMLTFKAKKAGTGYGGDFRKCTSAAPPPRDMSRHAHEHRPLPKDVISLEKSLPDLVHACISEVRASWNTYCQRKLIQIHHLNILGEPKFEHPIMR